MCKAHWGIAFHANGTSIRSRRWYRVSRLIEADGAWFELYWHPDITLRGASQDAIRERARQTGIELLDGVFEDAPIQPRRGPEMIRHVTSPKTGRR